ncbi:MAG: hypothetical protein ISP10_08755 [Aeromicrobium sp.]|nr:hypothetical protein [Aeromicrobium sp.]
MSVHIQAAIDAGSHGSSARRGSAWSAVAASVVVGTILLVTLGGYLASYRLDLEDYSHVWFSSAPYTPLSQWSTWFTEGYSDYFVNYPEWHGGGYALARPLMNLLVHAQGALPAVLGEARYLIVNYLALLGAVAVLVLLLGQLTELSPTQRMVAGVAFGLSPVWHQALYWPSLGTNAVALVFSLLGMWVLDLPSARPRANRLALSALFLVLAVMSHETAVIVPFVCVALYVARERSWRPVLRLWPLLSAPLVLAVERALMTTSDGVYALDFTAYGLFLRLVRVLAAPFVPFDAMPMVLWERPASLVGALPLVSVVIANLLIWVMLVAAARRRVSSLSGLEGDPWRSWLWLLIALTVSLVPAVMMRGEPRSMGVSFAVSLLMAGVVSRGRQSLRWLVLVVVLASSVALYAHGVLGTLPSQVDRVTLSGELFDEARAGIAAEEPDYVVLVNDRAAYYSGMAMLRMVAWPRRDLELIVVNGYEGPPAPDAEFDAVVENGVLEVRVNLGEGQRVRFDGAEPDFTVPNNGFVYRGLDETDDAWAGRFVATRQIDGKRALVIGVDPRTGEPIEPMVLVGQ